MGARVNMIPKSGEQKQSGNARQNGNEKQRCMNNIFCRDDTETTDDGNYCENVEDYVLNNHFMSFCPKR
jgi:hypothetical protein